MIRQLQRTFWSLYGRFVWDDEKAPWKETRVRTIEEILATRAADPGERVLDAGCGTGDYAVALARAGFQVTGVDYASGMLALARAKSIDALAGTLSFQQMDLNERLAFTDSSFDHIISISSLQVVANPTFTLGEFWRVLKPRGTFLLLHVPKRQSLTRPLQDVIKYRVSHLTQKTGWKITLVLAKAAAERTRATRYWTSEELGEMLRASQFQILSVQDGPPIVVLAEKSVER